jgi:hypothetical protein
LAQLGQAGEMHERALAIYEKLDNKEGLANVYGSLYLVYARRGELNRAEEMYAKAVALNEALGEQLKFNRRLDALRVE